MTEFLAFVGLRIFDKQSGLERVFFTKDPAYWHKIFASRFFRFDRDLGWDELEPVRGGAVVVPGKVHFASSYGDSYSYGCDVHLRHSWAYRFSRLSGREMLNLGLNAGGTDQAFLKLRKYYDRYPSHVVIMGILPENICRLVSVVRAFYWRGNPFPYVKPRFIITGPGKLKLVPPPVRYPDDLPRLSDPGFLRQTARHDFWYHHKIERYGFDSIYGRSFPSLPDVITVLRGIAHWGRKPLGYGYFYMNRHTEPYKVMEQILVRFSVMARKRNFKPLVMLHAEERNLDGTGYMKSFLRLVRKRLQIPVFEVAPVFNEHLRRYKRKRAVLFTNNRHYSPTGNDVLARGLVQFFRKQGLFDLRQDAAH